MGKELELSQEFNLLRQQYEDLREELVKLATEREILLTTEKRALETKYYLKIGRKQYQLYLLRNEVLRLRRKTEIIRASLNRGESYDLEMVEKCLDEELKRWEEEVLELFQKIRYAEYINKLPLLTPAEAGELKKLFRELVRRLHPDLNRELAEKNKHLWNRALAAYDHGDLQELKTLALLVEDKEKAKESFTATAELNTAIGKIKKQITHLLQDLAKIEQQFPFTLREKLDDEAWVKEQNVEMERQMSYYREQKLLYLSLLSDLTGNAGEGSTLWH